MIKRIKVTDFILTFVSNKFLLIIIEPFSNYF